MEVKKGDIKLGSLHIVTNEGGSPFELQTIFLFFQQMKRVPLQGG